MAKQTAKSPEKFKNIFMQQTSPNNPFGPNYIALPYDAKLAYKFSKMKGFVRPSKQDLVRKQDEDSKLIGTILMGFAFGALLGGAGRMIIKRTLPNLDSILNHTQHIYYPIIISLTTTWSYFKAYERYYEQVSKYFLSKYLAQAIQNGFQDYQVSK